MVDEKVRLEALHAAARTARTLARAEMLARARTRRAAGMVAAAEAEQLEAAAEHDVAREALEVAQHEVRVAHEACCRSCQAASGSSPDAETVN